MQNKQSHYQTNRKSLLRTGSLIAGISLLLLLGFNLILLTRSTPVIESDSSFSLLALFALFQPLLLIALLIGCFLLGMASTKIVTSSEGIEFHQFGFCTKSSWSNIARIAPFQSGNVSTHAIYFHQPAAQRLNLLPALPLMSLPLIPLYLFRFDTDSNLSNALAEYRPDLFI
jgi:hypothetical protein